MHHLEDRVAHHHEHSECEAVHHSVVLVALLAQRLRAYRGLQQALRPPGEEAENAKDDRGHHHLKETLLKECQLVQAVGVGLYSDGPEVQWAGSAIIE